MVNSTVLKVKRVKIKLEYISVSYINYHHKKKSGERDVNRGIF